MASEKRLADVNALLEEINRTIKIMEKQSNRLSIRNVIMCIKNAPTVDAVEVVRCKDCRKISPSVTPVKDAVWCREFRAYMPCDGFCSYGAKMDGDSNG